MWSRILRTAAIAGVLTQVCLAQSRFDDGEFKGFTKSPTEHIINRYERLVDMRSFAGTVVDPSGAPIGGVVVEVRGPGSHETITGAVTDSKGRFRIGRLRKGKYAFKLSAASNRSSANCRLTPMRSRT